jgi:hypothetical protein
MDNLLSVIALVGFSAVMGGGLGVLMVWLFYRPGVNRGPTQRLRHLIWSAILLLIDGLFAAMALGIYVQPGSLPSEQQAMGAGLCLGYTILGGWLAIRRLRKVRALEAASEAQMASEGPPAGPYLNGSPNRQIVMRAAVRKAIRTADYFIGAGLCGIALIGGTMVGTTARSWAARNGIHSAVLFFLLIHFVAFAYSQVVSGTAIRALNAAIRQDWQVRRRGQFLLAAGPLFFALPIGVLSIGMAVGIMAQLVALRLGYSRTNQPPAGTVATVRQLRRARRATAGAPQLSA